MSADRLYVRTRCNCRGVPWCRQCGGTKYVLREATPDEIRRAAATLGA